MENPLDKSASNEDLLDKSKDIPNSEKSNKERTENYFNQLRAWLIIMKSYQGYYNQLQQVSLQNRTPEDIINTVPENSLNAEPKNVPNTENEDIPNTPSEILHESVTEILYDIDLEVFQCQIPPLWKRILAEAIDIFLVHLADLLVYIISLQFGAKQPFHPCYYKDMFEIFNVDYSVDYAFLLKILLAAIRLRFILTINEILFYLYVYTFIDGVGPPSSYLLHTGKMLLGLVVVKVDKLYHIRDQPDDVIAVSVTTGILMEWFCIQFRLFIKFFFGFTLLFPLAFVDAPTNYNRSIYDILSGTMVVERLQPLCDETILIQIDIETDEDIEIEQNVDIDIDICHLIYR